MIIKNGEILAIDHIAHDNTLSGNGTSAKPVGLSQSTKDLIDSKVKKTDFETYKSSVANQIRDINNTITADESNFESYKETVAANFTAVDKRITDVANAKQDKGNYVSATNFNDFKNTVEGQIEALDTGKQPVGDYVVTNEFNSYKETVDGKFTTVNGRITDVANAKQDKGDYVSASDFNTYKTNVAGEIARVDRRIDTTSANLENNYYKKNQTYSQSEVDEIVSKLGAYVYVEDVNPDGSPNVDNPSSKVIYLTQIPNETQCLQWIWLETQEWKCIGDTTMNLSAYATKEWTNNNFETIDQFNTAIANYYTKGEVNTELATKVDNDDFNAYKTEVNGKFTNTSAWANEKFATKQNLTDTKAELEDTIESVSGEIISKVNTDYRTLDGKIVDIATTLSNDYYTSLEIDAILAASGEYYTKTESDDKYTEKTVFNTAINELSSNKLDKSATANWDVTEYTEGDNIKIVGHEISGKDWSNEIADAVENKVDESELENYYTSNQIDNKFVTNDDFNNLDNEVGVIDDDLNILSGKTVSVIKDSETVKAIRSTEPDGTISYTLSAHDGKQADYLWKPTVNAAGDISWELALTGDTPATANIKGSDGDDGKTPVLSANGTHIEWKYTDESIWNDLGDFKGEPGADGKDGKNGINGTSAFVRINSNTNYWEISNDNETWTSTDVSATGPQGEEGHAGDPGFSPTVAAVAITDGEKTGTEITFTYKDAQGQTQTTVYSAWNGVNGEGATVHFNGVDGIEITPRDTTHFDVGLSGDYKTAIESISADYAKTTDLNDYLKTSVAETTYQTIAGMNSYLTTGNAEQTYLELTQYAADSATFLVADSITGKVNITDFDTYKTSAHTEFVNTSSWANTAFQPKGNYVATADLLTAASNKLTGIKVGNTNYEIPLFGGVTTDTNTITGDGNTNPLGVAWSALSGNTITSALSAGSATVAANLGTSSFADITGAINAKADKPADMISNTPYCFSAGQWADMTQTYYSKTEATGTFLQKNLTNTLSGDGTSSNKLGVNWSNLSGNTITSALSAGSASYAVALGTTASYSGLSDIVGAINDAKFTGVNIATGSSITGNGLSTNNLGLASSAEDALTAVDNKLDITAAEQTYLPLTGGTVTGQITLTGNSWDNRLTIGRSNSAIDIGVASNGALTLKANVNNACQFNMMQTGTSGVDINITYGQTPTAIGNLYVMKTHTTAEATTASGSWNGDNLLHIILES